MFLDIFACALKSKHVAGSCICLTAKPKLDEKLKILIIREFRMSQY